MRPNRLRALLTSGRTVHGPIIQLADPAVVELAGIAGFDFVLIDLEHSTLGPDVLPGHLRAAEAAGLGSLVRLGVEDVSMLRRALDAGVDGVVISGARTAAQVRSAVRETRFPPLGERGLHINSRHTGYGRDAAEGSAAVMARENRDVILGVFLGERTPESEAGPILESGIDLAILPVGLWDEQAHPGLVTRLIERCHARNVTIASAADHTLHGIPAAELGRRGARLLLVGGDATSLLEGWRARLERARSS